MLCCEKKHLLNGKVILYDCELITVSKEFGILKYFVDREYKVGSIVLQPGIVTYGFYWTDRPYTLYKWFDKKGEVVGNYFNIADSILLTPQEFSWRDLVVDILVLPSGGVEVLDEDEIPHSLDEGLNKYIESSKQMILQHYQEIIPETTLIIKQFE